LAKQRPPSELVEDIERRLQEIQRKAAESSEQAGYAHKVVSAGKPYWQALDEPFISGRTDEIVASGYHFLESLHGQVQALDEQSIEFRGQVRSAASNVDVYADVTASTASVSGFPMSFDPEPLRRLRYSFEGHDDYAHRLKGIDPALAETFRGIKESYFGSTSDNLRMALSEARQTFDHLFDTLVPDDKEVRQQSWWSPEDAKKPQVVTRTQRIRYAAEKYVRDHNQRKVLINSAQHMNDVYNKLLRLHTRGPLDDVKDKDALFEMITIIRRWVDYISS